VKRFILAYGDSAGGCLKQTHIAERVVAVDADLVAGPTPDISDIASFYREKHRLSGSREDDFSADVGDRIEKTVFDEASSFDRFELWFSPRPTAQLALAQFIGAIAARPDLAAKTVLVPLDADLTFKKPDWVLAQTFTYLPLDAAMITSASAAWSAWRAPTPVPWRTLMDQPAALPCLAPVIPRLLAELPDGGTGLSLTQTRILRLVASGAAAIILEIIGAWEPLHGDPACSYWPFGQLLLDMFHGPAPLLSGMRETSFDLDLLSDHPRHTAFVKSAVALTPFGRDVLDGKADYAAVAPIDRHWGGTHLTPDNLWRWNTTTGTLIAP
jgi:hypothetical protein